MSLVYITNASLNLISQSIKNKKKTISIDTITSDISNDLFHDFDISQKELKEYFNKFELEKIYYNKMVVKNLESLLSSIEENKNLIVDYIKWQNKKYAYDTKTPAYHVDKDCQYIKQPFINIQIAEECLSNKDTSLKAKQWIQKNKNLSFEEMNTRFKQEFNCSKGLIKVNFKNSGKLDYENDTITNIAKGKIKKYRIQLRFLLDGEMSKKINNYKYAPKSVISKIENSKNTEKFQEIIDFHTAKNELEKIITKIYIEKYNAELLFNQPILDSIGFSKCKGCN